MRACQCLSPPRHAILACCQDVRLSTTRCQHVVGRTFLKICDEEYPENHVFHNIFNRNTVKIKYSCMPNLKKKIDDNKSTLQKTTTPISKACNCRRPADCPVTGNCLKSSVIYQATVTTEYSRPAQTYVGLTENSFKTRFCQSQIF